VAEGFRQGGGSLPSNVEAAFSLFEKKRRILKNKERTWKKFARGAKKRGLAITTG